MKRWAAHSVYDRNMVTVSLSLSILLVSTLPDSQMYDVSRCLFWHGIIIHRMSLTDDICRTTAAHAEPDLTLGSMAELYGGYREVSSAYQFPGLPLITRKKTLGEIVDLEGRFQDWNEYGEPSSHLTTAFVSCVSKLHFSFSTLLLCVSFPFPKNINGIATQFKCQLGLSYYRIWLLKRPKRLIM